MKINASLIKLQSEHNYESFTYAETKTVEAKASEDLPAAILKLSKESKDENYVQAMKDIEDKQKAIAEENKKNNFKNNFANMIGQTKNTGSSFDVRDELEGKIAMLRKILSLLNGGFKGKGRKIGDDILDLRSPKHRPQFKPGEDIFSLGGKGAGVAPSSLFGNVSSNEMMAQGSNGLLVNGEGLVQNLGGAGTVWQRVTASSGFFVEKEQTTFSGMGTVITADGKQIDFNVDVSLSRACMASFSSLTAESYILTDPLVINLDTNIPSVSDQKFYFDIDSDGKAEEMSFTGKDSGFLALDKNGDGIINDGSELFGTKSGDGFRDLAAYDEDGNGWIDESDSVFNQLKVWVKDEEGKDIL